MFGGMLENGAPNAALPPRRDEPKDGETAVLEPARSVLTPGCDGRRLARMEPSP
jgi:hypothetical protein